MVSKTIRIASIGAIVLSLLSCSNSASSNAEEQATSTVATETGDCRHEVVEAAVGEPSDSIACYGIWASVMPNSYAGSCSECESVWLYKWESGKWSLKGSCNQYNPLLSTGCYGLSGTLQNSVSLNEMAEIPDQKTACKIWDVDSSLWNIAETGCTPSPKSIKDARTQPCDDYYDETFLPIGPCNKGRGVRSIQKRLVEDGARIDLDGYFGTGTTIAVMDFQTAHGLPMSGYVDEKTWKTLIPNQAELPGSDTNHDGLVTPDEFQ